MRLKLLLFVLIVTVILEATLTNAKPKKKSSSEEKDDKKDKKDKDDDSSKEKDKKFEKSNKQFSKQKKCQGKDWKPAKRLVKGFEKCADDNGKDKREGPVCTALCAWKEAEVIQDGKFDKEELEKLVDELLPGDLKDGREEMKKKWAKCQKKDFDEDEKDDHEKCHKWYKVLMCFRTNLYEHCSKGNEKDSGKESEEKGGGGGLKKFFAGLG